MSDPLPFMTGFTDGNPAAQAMSTDPPDIGAICQYLGLGPNDLSGAVGMPCFPDQGKRTFGDVASVSCLEAASGRVWFTVRRIRSVPNHRRRLSS